MFDRSKFVKNSALIVTAGGIGSYVAIELASSVAVEEVMRLLL